MKLFELFKEKIYPFVKKYWKYILIFPVLYYIYKSIKDRKNKTTSKEPNFVKDQIDISREVHNIDSHANTEINRIESEAEKEKNGIDDGNPTPAQIFDREIKK